MLEKVISEVAVVPCTRKWILRSSHTDQGLALCLPHKSFKANLISALSLLRYFSQCFMDSSGCVTHSRAKRNNQAHSASLKRPYFSPLLVECHPFVLQYTLCWLAFPTVGLKYLHMLFPKAILNMCLPNSRSKRMTIIILAGWGTLQSWTTAQKMILSMRTMSRDNHWSHKKLSCWQHASHLNKHSHTYKDWRFPCSVPLFAPTDFWREHFYSRSHHTSIWVSWFFTQVWEANTS